jgi:putative ABC transport system permease protein
MALATAILVASLFTRDTMEQLIDVTYFLADRQDATIGFSEKRIKNVVEQVNRLPGVLAAEPFREVPVRIRYGNVERRITISGRPADADLRRLIDVDLRRSCFRRRVSRSPACSVTSSGWGPAIPSRSICWRAPDAP